MNAQTLLRVSKMTVKLDEKVVFKDLSFELRENDTLIVLGPNGAGKTVLLRALLGLLPHEGEVLWKDGIHMGYVPQRIPLNRDLPVTVADFFGLKRVSSQEAAGILKEVGLDDPAFLTRQLAHLSSGQFQRVLIAWALVKSPQVLLFDEPTSGIDIGGEETIHDLLKKTQKERAFAMILVTHDLSAVYGEATRVLCMGRKNICYGKPGDVLHPDILKAIYGMEIKFFRHADE